MIVIIHGFFCNIFDKDKITLNSKKIQLSFAFLTLESRIDVGQGINVGPGKFVKKNKRRALNKRRA